MNAPPSTEYMDSMMNVSREFALCSHDCHQISNSVSILTLSALVMRTIYFPFQANDDTTSNYGKLSRIVLTVYL